MPGSFLLPDEEQRMQQGALTPTPDAPAANSDFLLPGEQTAGERATATLRRAVPVNPDQAGEQRRLSSATGVPEPVVERNLDQVKTEARIREIQAAMADSPILARQLTDPNFAKLAHDDVQNLKEVGRSIGATGTWSPGASGSFEDVLRTPDQLQRNLPNELKGIAAAFVEAPDQVRQGLRQIFGDVIGSDAMSADASRKAAQSRGRQSAATPEHAGILDGDIYGGLVSTVTNAPAIAASFVNPIVGFALMGVQAGAPAYTKYRDRGATGGEAALGASLEGGAEVLGELAPMGFLVKQFGRVGAGQFIRGLLGREIPSEIGTTIAQTAVDTAIANPTKTWNDWVNELPAEIRSTVVATIVQGGVHTAASSAVHALGARALAAERGENDAQALENLVKLAQASKVRERDASSFQSYVDAAAEDGPVQNIHVSAAVFQQAAGEQLPEILQAMPSVAAQLQEATTRGGDLVIPLGEFATSIAGTGMESKLLDHVRTGPDAMTREEAKVFMQSGAEQFQKEAETILADQATTDEFVKSAQVVEADLLAQLKSVNRFTDDVNKPYATLVSSFYTTMAQRLGITPQEMYARYPLRVAASSVQGERTMDQAPLDNPKFKKWFGESKVTDAKGAPIVVYHGSPDARFVNDTGVFATMKDRMLRFGSTPESKAAASEERAFFFTSSRQVAKTYADDHRAFDYQAAEPDVIPTYLAISNPLVFDAKGLHWRDAQQRISKDDFIKRAKKDGHDGVVIRNVRDSYDSMATGKDPLSDVYVAFRPEQIKSAIGNNGDFDPTNPSILKQSEHNSDHGRDQKPTRPELPAGEKLQRTVAGGHPESGWARATRIRGKDGKPAPFYRGASVALAPEHFKLDALGRASGNASSGLGVWLTVSQDEAAAYGNTEAFFLDMRNPKVFKVEDLPGFDSVEQAHNWRESLRREGFDGLLISAKHLGGRVHAVAFTPEQVVHSKQNRRVLEQPAFHGSPHDFDKFSTDKIGTGEGAQAYGWGLYFAENPGIAAGYHERLAGNPQIVELKLGTMRLTQRNGFDYSRHASDNSVENVRASLAEDLLINETDLRGAQDAQAYVLKQLDERIASYYNPEHDGDMIEAAKRLRKELARKGAVSAKWEKATGGVYQVDISDEHLVKMLDWDAPFKGQEVASAIYEAAREKQASFGDETVLTIFDDIDRNENDDAAMTGGAFYEKLAYAFGDGDVYAGQEKASRYLNSIGVPGIRYDDASSRDPNVKSKTKNIVVFDESIVKLTHKDGKPVTAQERKDYFQAKTSTPNARGQISFAKDITQNPSVITLLNNADLSTFLHELGHFQLEVLTHVASQPNAPQQIVDDMGTLLKWFGVSDLATWQAMGLEEKRPYHEQFARGAEAYLFEGKAPNVELQGVFQRFRAWMVNVYKTLAGLNVTLTDEVRGVMDRLVATDEQIATAEASRGYMALFKSAEEMNATPEEWRAYQELGAQQTQAAVEQLQTRGLRDMKWLTNARSRALKKLQKEAKTQRAAVEAEVRDEVRKQPIYAVQRFLRYGEIPQSVLFGEGVTLQGKLDLAALKEMYGEDPAALWRYLPVGEHGLAAAEGLHPDLVAQLFGFTSGDHLVRDILAAEPESTVVEGMTDQRMLERYGDLSSPQGLEKAVDEALHNDARARFIATELNALAKATGQPRVLAKAAKAFAATIIGRKKVRDVKPAQYTAAEARAGRAAEKAKSLPEKAAEKRNQLVNHYAARAAHDALDEVQKGVEYLKKLDTEAARKRIDAGYMDQIDQLLERFDLRSGQSLKAIDKRTALAEWITAQEDMGFEPTISDHLRNEAFRKSFKDMTVEEVRGLIDAVRNIEHLGRLKKKLLTAADEREFEAVVGEIVASIEDNATGTVKERRQSDRGFLVEAGRLFRGFLADHRKFASLAREMDGWKDAGAMWEYLVRSMNKAGDTEAVQREKATVKLGELLAPIMKEGKLGKKTYFAKSGKTFTREERIAIALNMGNEVNRERIVNGEGMTPDAVVEVLDTLTKTEWDFVQGVWDYFESFRPAIAAKERRLTGTEPDWVEPAPIQTKFGAYRGGYYPIAYDSERSSKSEADSAAAVQKQLERGLYTRAQTRRGHLKARVESTGRPLRYSLTVITQHVDQVVHDLAWHEYLIDANRLMRAAGIDAAIREHYGPEKLRTMKQTLTDIAVGDLAAQGAGERILNGLRHGASVAGLGWRVTTSLLQPLGLTQSMVRIGSKWVLRGAKHWMGDAVQLENSVRIIGEKSDFMRLRAKTMQREISEIRNKVTGGDSKLQASYFYLIQKMQLVADVPTWWGAYEKAMSEKDMSESKAIALADQAVRDAQGGGQIGDLAAAQRGSAGWKLFTNFYSFFNTTFNLTRESIARTKSVKDVPMLAADLLLLYTVPAMLNTLMKAALAGDWDEEEKLVRRLIADQLNYLLGTVVLVREANSAVQASLGLTGDYSGPASVRFFADLSKLAKQAEQGEADEAFWKALNSVGGTVFHYPAGQINATADGLATLADGRTQNPGALLVGSNR